MKLLLVLPFLALAACSTPTQPSGMLSTYDGLAVKPGAVRASISDRRDEAGLEKVHRVALAPTLVAENTAAWMSALERTTLLREIDAQLCFELSERYEIAAPDGAADARVRAVLSHVRATGRVGSAASAAASFFIPGPIGVRAPGTLGGLGVEAEMVAADGGQLAAITWTRQGMAVGTDNPSLSRIGDALQFAEPFADDAAKVMTAKDRKPIKLAKPDPCAQYGSRMRVEGMAAKFATGLYVPQMSGARAQEASRP
ncbi:DUF3313 family protein [Phenylobacterium sp.]|uniref:DUF3313 family protein n=1 Tax=Phenylobacterium sp. TaxID=1871053 RepID=UPI0030F49504